MKLFGNTNQENREEKGALHSWERALYQLGREKAHKQQETRESYLATGYRENSLELLGWPTLSDIIETLTNNAAENQATETPYEDLLAALVPASQKLIRSHIGPAEAKRLAMEQQIAIFHDHLRHLNTVADYYLSLQAVGELSFHNAKSLENQVSPNTIKQVAEGEFSVPLHQWVKGLILRLAAPQSTYAPSRPEEPPAREPTSAELKKAANWIHQPHFGLGRNLPEAIEVMKRYRLEAHKRGDTVKSYPLEDILKTTRPIHTLKGEPIDWQAWKFLPCPLFKSKEATSQFLAENPQATALIQTEQAQAFANRWLRAIALRGAINSQFLEIDINQQEQTEQTIINPAKADADAFANGIPELHLLVATEMAWEYTCFYWIQEI